ncbi:MAG: fibronectin type III domain-containing protein [Verrucomicrobia bacterium]|nr:fibronectin type III domain-containing protein [Verrucomicrobiota bacterium]
MDNAIGAVNKQITVVGNLLLDRNAKTTKLRRRLRGTIAALTQSLDPLDMLWESFGLNRPGQKARPDQPEKPTVVLVDNEAASLQWKRPARAAHYRVWMKVKGVDGEFLPVGSPADLDFTYEKLPPNAEVEFSISAVNPGGESPLSEGVTVRTLPVKGEEV